nr:hypothetical protein [Tanacetum cinerariifolium]
MHGENARNFMAIQRTHGTMKDSRKKSNGRVVMKRQTMNHLSLILKHLKSKGSHNKEMEFDVPSTHIHLVILGALSCQLPPKELNPRSFTLPCIIGSLNLYAMSNLGASVSVMPKSIFEHLKLANLKETNMCTRSCDNENIDTLDSVDNMQELEVKHEDMDCGMWPTCKADLIFCSGYNATYGKGENGMLEQWMCFRDHERQSVDGNHMIFIDFLKNKKERILPWMMHGKNARNFMAIQRTHGTMKDSRKKSNGRVVLKRQTMNHLSLILKHLKSKGSHNKEMEFDVPSTRIHLSTTMGDENHIRTLGDYSKPSHKGYMNTFELLVGKNVVPLRFDTFQFVPNEGSFHRLRSDDPNQHLKDFLKLVDSLDLDGENIERTRLRLFQFFLRDQASNWCERVPAGSITTWEDLTTRFLAQFFLSGRTVKLRNDILMSQQHHGESLSEAWTRFKDLLQKVPHYGIDRWLQIQIFYDHVSFHLKCETDRAAGSKLQNKNADESWEIIESLALYDHEDWNDIKEFVKPELTTSRTSKKVLIREEAKLSVTKNVNSISLARGEEERNDKIDIATGNDIEKPTVTETGIQVKEAEKKNEAGKEEMTEILRKTPFLTMANAIIKFDKGTIILRSGKTKISFHRILESLCKIKRGVKNDIYPISPTMTVNRLVMEWEKRIKLHLEREIKLDQWKSNNFKSKHPALVKVKGRMDDEGEVT